LLTHFREIPHGCSVQFAGTAEQLAAAGLADPAWFAQSEFGVSGQRTRSDEWGNRVELKRRAKGRFELFFFINKEDCWDLNSPSTRKLIWFREHGAELDTAVDRILAGLGRPRESQP
jgi:hypothetical protein